MNLFGSKTLLRWVLVSLFFLSACAQNSSGGGSSSAKSCAGSQGLNVAFHQVLTKSSRQSNRLILKMDQMNENISQLKSDLNDEFGSSSVKVSVIAKDTVAVRLPPAIQT